ncbi:MAG: stage II sporulation protein R [Clostridia bacterium]|nr:stage II sporulation protein R [Clostridia bacterium]
MKYLVMFTALILACCLCCGFVPSEEDMAIYENTVRLHVIANSDSEHDQSVKLLVRDSVLGELNALLENAQTQEEALKIIEGNLDRLRAVCNETLEALGEEANAELYLKQEKYPTRHYENISLPAGVYRSLQIRIGDADGKNWWCVLFPTLCTSAAKTEEALIRTGFTSDQIGVLTGGDRPKYKLKFKILEFFGENFSG